MSDDFVSIARERLADGRHVSDIAVLGLLVEIDRLRLISTAAANLLDAPSD